MTWAGACCACRCITRWMMRMSRASARRSGNSSLPDAVQLLRLHLPLSARRAAGVLLAGAGQPRPCRRLAGAGLAVLLRLLESGLYRAAAGLDLVQLCIRAVDRQGRGAP